MGALGPLPERISGVERWKSAAGAIEAYRVRWGVTTADALGPEPVDPEQRAHWHRVLAASGSVAAGSGPGEGPDQAWVSSLSDRVHALDVDRLNTPGTRHPCRSRHHRLEPQCRRRTGSRKWARTLIGPLGSTS